MRQNAAAAAASTAANNDNDDAGTNDAAAGGISGDERTLLFSTTTNPKVTEVIAAIKANPTTLPWEAMLATGLYNLLAKFDKFVGLP